MRLGIDDLRLPALARGLQAVCRVERLRGFMSLVHGSVDFAGGSGSRTSPAQLLRVHPHTSRYLGGALRGDARGGRVCGYDFNR